MTPLAGRLPTPRQSNEDVGAVKRFIREVKLFHLSSNCIFLVVNSANDNERNSSRQEGEHTQDSSSGDDTHHIQSNVDKAGDSTGNGTFRSGPLPEQAANKGCKATGRTEVIHLPQQIQNTGKLQSHES